MKIVANAKELNKLHARIFAFGVGYDVNSRLLDKLVRENFGQSEYVRPNEDIEDRVSKLYSRIESPVLTGVQLQFVFDEIKTEEGNPVNRVYPKDSFDLFAGEQLVVVGRYRKSGTAKVIVQGSVGEQPQKFDFPATFVEKSSDDSLASSRSSGPSAAWAKSSTSWTSRARTTSWSRSWSIWPRGTASSRPTPRSWPTRTPISTIWLPTRAVPAVGWMRWQSSGAGGFAQRAMKGGFQRPNQAPATAAAPHGQLRPRRAVGGSARFRRRGRPRGQVGQQNVRNIGNRTFFRRNGQWVDSQVTK